MPATTDQRRAARKHADALVTEHDDAGTGTVYVCVGGRRIAAGLSYQEAEELALDLRREVARAMRAAIVAASGRP